MLRSGKNGRDAIFDCIHVRMLPAHVHFFQSLCSLGILSVDIENQSTNNAEEIVHQVISSDIPLTPVRRRSQFVSRCEMTHDVNVRGGEKGRYAIFDCIHGMLPGHVHFLHLL